MPQKAVPSPHDENGQQRTAAGSFMPRDDKQGILESLNLEDTVSPVICAFAIERSKGVFLAAAASPFNSHRPKPRRHQEQEWVDDQRNQLLHRPA